MIMSFVSVLVVLRELGLGYVEKLLGRVRACCLDHLREETFTVSNFLVFIFMSKQFEWVVIFFALSIVHH